MHNKVPRDTSLIFSAKMDVLTNGDMYGAASLFIAQGIVNTHVGIHATGKFCNRVLVSSCRMKAAFFYFKIKSLEP